MVQRAHQTMRWRACVPLESTSGYITPVWYAVSVDTALGMGQAAVTRDNQGGTLEGE